MLANLSLVSFWLLQEGGTYVGWDLRSMWGAMMA